MDIKFWGVRGSIPSSLDSTGWVHHFEKVMKSFFAEGYTSAQDIANFLSHKSIAEIGGYGTATTCVEVTSDNQSILIDGGSGLRSKSDEILAIKSTQNEFHILLTHFHFDHIMGLPFFSPHYKKSCKIHYYCVQSEAEKIVKSLFQKPIFPITFENLSAEIHFHQLKPYSKNTVNGFTITPFATDHPDTCFGFRIEKNGKVYAHAVDNEAIRITRDELGKDAGLYDNADLVYFDAQYEELDMGLKKGWGHGTCDRGFKVCREFGIKQILFAHHDPAANNEDIGDQKRKAQQFFEQNYAKEKLIWDFAFEGMKIHL